MPSRGRSVTCRAVSLVFWDLTISRLEGIAMVTSLGAFLILSIRRADPQAADLGAPPPPLYLSAIFALLGLAGVLIGAYLLVDSATTIARFFGVSEAVIGLTIVAVGTSLPEMATSIVAAYRGQRDIAVGNAIGSNVFNVLGIMGATAAVAPIPLRPGS